jgi:predicted Zn-dependent peptidase
MSVANIGSENVVKLDNGLKLIYSDIKTIPGRVNITFVFNVGSCNDCDKPGISHLAEHMAFGGTQTKDAKTLLGSLDNITFGNYYAYTASDKTVFGVYTNKNSLSDAISLMVEMFAKSKVDDAYLEKEKKVVAHELNLRGDNPNINLFNLFHKSFDYKNDDTTQKEFLTSLTSTDVKSFMSKNYTPENCTLIVTGDIDEDLLEWTVERKTKLWKQSNKNEGFVEKFTFKPGVFIEQGNTKSVYVGVVFDGPTTSDIKDFISCNIFNCIVGSGLNSKMMHNARIDKGLTYDIRPIMMCEKNYGLWGVMTATDKESYKELVDTVAESISSFKGLINSDNVAIARMRIKASILDEAIKPAEKTAEIMFFEDLGIDKDALISLIDRTTADDVQNWLNNSFASGCSLAIYGDVDNQDIHGLDFHIN